MKTALILLGFLAIVLVAVALEPREPAPPALQSPQTAIKRGAVTIGTTTIVVDIADTPRTHAQGLSGRASLPEGEGMLFVFKRDGDWGIWMKNMRFAIDIIWAASDGRIITIERDVTPKTYPNTFHSAEPARYVLEVPAGFAAARGISEGMFLVIQ